MAKATPCALIVLAAGASRRMGRPKQLLPVGGVPLVRRVVEQLGAAAVTPLVVVLGAAAPEVAAALEGLSVRTVVNPSWAEGMGSSIRAGVVAALEAEPALSTLIVALGDHPNVTAAHLERLRAVHEKTGRAVVASESGGVLQPPVLFAAEYFSKLLALQGETGARALLHAAGESLTTVPAGELSDLDTPEDYAAFVERYRDGRENG